MYKKTFGIFFIVALLFTIIAAYFAKDYFSENPTTFLKVVVPPLGVAFVFLLAFENALKEECRETRAKYSRK